MIEIEKCSYILLPIAFTLPFVVKQKKNNGTIDFSAINNQELSPQLDKLQGEMD